VHRHPNVRRVDGGPRRATSACWQAFCGFCAAGACWCDLRGEFPSPATCWRRLRDWEEQEVWLEIWRAFLSELNERQQLRWSESFLDGSDRVRSIPGCFLASAVGSGHTRIQERVSADKLGKMCLGHFVSQPTPRPSETTRKSYRPRISDRTMVGT
jgi:hypothetical protein